MKTLIVGAGLAGLVCARELQAAGDEVSLIDKGRGYGGRLSSRRREGLSFDHGAPELHLRPEDLAETDVLAEWRPEGGPARLVATPRQNELLKHLGAGLAVEHGARALAVAGRPGEWWVRTDQGERGPAERVVVAVPAPQAVPLLAQAAPQLSERVAQASYAPCWTLLYAPAADAEVPAWERHEPDSGPLSLVIAEQSKPGRGPEPRYVAHATTEWARAHLEDSADEVQAALLAALAEVWGGALPEPRYAAAHRWRYARVAQPLGEPCLNVPER
ncbi:MAG TPA: deoxyribodipyrimidine photolyase, partial [Planctomycetes bacterium]|nr:deoxyribodipyrimidine photolyase [Planctomycetota bacterium]